MTKVLLQSQPIFSLNVPFLYVDRRGGRNTSIKLGNNTDMIRHKGLRHLCRLQHIVTGSTHKSIQYMTTNMSGGGHRLLHVEHVNNTVHTFGGEIISPIMFVVIY
eukprot:TRINITY_DN39171_c0_g2_i1.p1 TRINITY_DN39171_c0_g2~~TRINITY_DN39171_c0_g2_i1.p1  ORF type:complete len:105 (+),score=11.80 TRINITY_DN39171_c0_g2_i1:336-650(+)